MKIRFVLFISILVLVSSCSSVTSHSDREPDESKLIQAQPKIFSRTSDTLTIKFSNGTKKDFRNNEKTPDSTIKTSLENYFSQQEVVLVMHRFYEGSAFEAFSIKSGQSIPISGIPVWSSDGKNFVTTNADVSDYTPNELLIVNFKDGIFKTLYKKEVPTGEVKWVNNIRVKIEALKLNEATMEFVPDGLWTCDLFSEKTNCFK